MRLSIVRSQGRLFEGPGSGRNPDVLAFTADRTGWKDTAAWGLEKHGRYAASPFAGTKTLSWAHNLAFYENAHRGGFDDVILLNERGEVGECTSANIFAVRSGVTLTPPLASGPLPGVTRQVMIEELAERVDERTLAPEDLFEVDGVFITSSTRELMPVERTLARDLPGGANGWPVMERLRVQLRVYVADYVRSAR